MSGRTTVIATLLLGILAMPQWASSQQPAKIPRIGVIGPGTPSAQLSAAGQAFRQGMHDLGYVEGKSIVIESRWTEGNPDRYFTLAAELGALKVDVILVPTNSAARAARKATATLPIVMAVSVDAVEEGLVRSLARPGGNITGLTIPTAELSGKRLESAIGQAARGGAGALLMVQDALFTQERTRIAKLALAQRLPTMSRETGFAEVGGLMNYGPSIAEMYRRAAAYVDKILKGAKAADLPVEQPEKLEFIINLKTARTLGLTLPQSVLIRADRVIR